MKKMNDNCFCADFMPNIVCRLTLAQMAEAPSEVRAGSDKHVQLPHVSVIEVDQPEFGAISQGLSG